MNTRLGAAGRHGLAAPSRVRCCSGFERRVRRHGIHPVRPAGPCGRRHLRALVTGTRSHLSRIGGPEFAQGAMAMFGAYAYYDFTERQGSGNSPCTQ